MGRTADRTLSHSFFQYLVCESMVKNKKLLKSCEWWLSILHLSSAFYNNETQFTLDIKFWVDGVFFQWFKDVVPLSLVYFGFDEKLEISLNFRIFSVSLVLRNLILQCHDVVSLCLCCLVFTGILGYVCL